LANGLPEDAPALSGLGYPRVIAYLHKQISKDELLRLLIQDTRQYAKRQLTWFRHQLPVQWKK
jgi:tRNA dimethylallyltransferase